jgi:hypothetical protein
MEENTTYSRMPTIKAYCIMPNRASRILTYLGAVYAKTSSTSCPNTVSIPSREERGVGGEEREGLEVSRYA